ncbi:addiction module toxin, Txe/YoeB family [Desulfonatronospira thiodismutans ASO3-1]|uniref:Putative mRNA interferase YoeB n=1 Tax=Desulfonatronospira thiodismutans ASO3-1 TaxID=555779 RepID=D6SU11_9BACT|nr:Txe/YoeB family addiction module toxin [Desulfonatronospira thiodismutans]EFI33102.1 addiction module toxin, Txe/YoeB family [Desulfonatronospira thiodismutans ASO3-1]
MRLVFDDHAFEDFSWFISNDPKLAKKTIALIQDIKRTPFKGIGKPEPLKHELSGCWSRRINTEHRLVYQVTEEEIRILACRYHYK